MQPGFASTSNTQHIGNSADALASYAVPQRFGIAALLCLTTLFACLFAALRVANAPPAVYLFFGVSRPEYAALKGDEALPELARRFLCAAFIENEGGERVRAAQLHLQAAWASDDAGEKSAAARCRQLAAEAVHRAMAAQRTIAGGEAADYTLLADLYRRSGDHVRSLVMANNARAILENSPADAASFGGIVSFLMARSLAHDSQPYTIAEARSAAAMS